MPYTWDARQLLLSSLLVAMLSWAIGSCSPQNPVDLLHATATPPIAVIGVPGSEVDPDKYIVLYVDEEDTSGFHSIAIRLTNISDHRVRFDSYEPAYIFFRADPGADWIPAIDQLASFNQASPLSLSPLSEADGMEMAKVILNLILPDPAPADAQARVIFVGVVVDEQGVGHRLVHFVDIDSSMFGWSPPNSSLVPLGSTPPPGP